MSPDRELEYQIAEKVLGYRRVVGPAHDYDGPCEPTEFLVPPTLSDDDAIRMLPPRGSAPFGYLVAHHYSTDIAETLRVLARVFPWPRFWTSIRQVNSGNWRCDIELHGGDGPTISASDKSMAVAICKTMIEAKAAV